MTEPKLSPKAALLALQSGAPAPVSVAPTDWERARALLSNLSAASAEDVLQLPEALALALLDAAVAAKAPELPSAVAELKSPLARAAKRALYQLKSLGVAAPGQARPPAVRAPPTAETGGEAWPCLMSPVLGNGERALVIARSVPGGVQTFEVTYSDEQGILHLSSGEVGRASLRKELKRLREDVGRGGRRSVVEIDLDEAKTLLADAAGQNLTSKLPPPPGAEVALRKLDLVASPTPAPLPTPEIHDASLAQEGASLHLEPELRAWLPPEMEIRQFALAVDALATSPLQLSKTQKAEGLLQRIQAMAENFFTPDMQRLYARRLWQMGRYFELSDRAHPAEVARAEARRLFHAESSSASPFCRRLFEKVLQLSAETANAEATASSDKAPEPARPSSLILYSGHHSD